MSDHHAPAAEIQGPHTGINIKTIVMVGVVSLVLFGLSAVAALLMLNHYTAKFNGQHGVASEAKLIGQPEIGIVDSIHFDSDQRLPAWRAERHRHLTGYGWVDKTKNVAHVPIDKAMDEVIRQAAAAPPVGEGRAP